MDKVVWGIIGCGDVTEVKSGPALQKCEGSELAAVMRRTPGLAKDYAKRHNVPRWYEKAEELIADPEVNAVYIATPPSFHVEHAVAAANAGKHIYVEKPVGTSLADTEKIVKAAEANGVKLYTAYYRRGLPKFNKIKELIEAGEIGRPLAANTMLHMDMSGKHNNGSDWHVRPEISGCGYFCDLAPHTLDILMYYLGEITEATGKTSRQKKEYPAEDIVTAMYSFPNDIHGAGSWCFNASEQIDLTTISGDKGSITFSTFTLEPVVLKNRNGKQKFDFPAEEHIQQPLIQSVVNDILGKEECPSTGKNALAVNRVLDKVTGRVK